MDGADGCRLRERMSGQDGAAGVAAAPGQFLTRALAPAASHCGEAGPSHRGPTHALLCMGAVSPPALLHQWASQAEPLQRLGPQPGVRLHG